LSGKPLDAPQKMQKGQKVNMNQAEIDHVKAKSKGGTNSNSNAQVLSKEENLKKGNR
jgi:5-methylcytosine-specific restriction endonuclease McrA